MKSTLKLAISTVVFVWAAGVLCAADDRAPQYSPSSPRLQPAPAQPTLTLSPAVVTAKVQPGQGVTQTFRMSNLTPARFRFDIEVQDVVVKDGKRIFAPAGETAGSIAATARRFSAFTDHRAASPEAVTITLTMPRDTAVRGVVVFFRGKVDAAAEDGSVVLGGSLGGLFTFNVSQDFNLEAASFSTVPQTETANLSISHELVNSGREVVVPKGSTAVLDEMGRRVSKATFEPHRLMPGERLEFKAVNPTQLEARSVPWWCPRSNTKQRS